MTRRRPRDTLVYGRHPIEALFEHDPLGIKELWLAEGLDPRRHQALSTVGDRYGVPVHTVGRATLDRLSHQGVHQGVLARYRETRSAAEAGGGASLDGVLARQRSAEPLLLLLDGVEDPRNFGACLRSAAAAGVDAVVVPRSRGTSLGPEARKAAAGAAELVPVLRVANLARCMSDLAERGLALVGATGDAEHSLYRVDLRGPVAMVLGAEGRGLRRLTRERCDTLVRIPVASSMASLNVSVATGVCLFEACRQRERAPGTGSLAPDT